MIFVYTALVFIGIMGAYGTKLLDKGNNLGAIGVILAGILTSAMWVWVSKTQKDLIIINVVWDAVYALAWTVGIYCFIESKVSPTQFVGMILIFAGLMCLNWK